MISLKENYFQHELAFHKKVGPFKPGEVCMNEHSFLLLAFQISFTKYFLTQINKERFKVGIFFENVQKYSSTTDDMHASSHLYIYIAATFPCRFIFKCG